MTAREFARKTGWGWWTIAGWVRRRLLIGHWSWRRMDLVLDAEMTATLLAFKAKYRAATASGWTADRLAGGTFIRPSGRGTRK